jgi:hypothetical protein
VFKRLRWTLLGALAGAGGSIWVGRRVRRTVGRYVPEQLRNDARQWLTGAGDDLRAAIEEGRAAMRDREAELHARFADRLIAEPVRRGRIIDAGPLPAGALPVGPIGALPVASGGSLPPLAPAGPRLRVPEPTEPTTTQSERATGSHHHRRRRH